MGGLIDSAIAAARARADGELRKTLSDLDPDDFSSNTSSFDTFIRNVRLLFIEEAAELLRTSTDYATFKLDVRRLREQMLDEFAEAPPGRKLTKRQRKRLERPMDLDKKLSVVQTDEWDLFAPTSLLPQKKHGVREELKRVLGEQLPYWLHEGARHHSPNELFYQKAPVFIYNYPNDFSESRQLAIEKARRKADRLLEDTGVRSYAQDRADPSGNRTVARP